MLSGYAGINGKWNNGSLVHTLSRELYPSNLKDVLEWASDLWLHDGLYTQTIRQAVRYFMTELKIIADQRDIEDKYVEYITGNYDLLEEGAKVGDEAVAFGNSFSSIHLPIERRMSCPKCSINFPFRAVRESIRFNSSNPSFSGVCPVCKKESEKWGMTDSPVRSRIPKVVRWDPCMIQIAYNNYTGNAKYSFDPQVDNTLTSGIKGGDMMLLEDTPWEVIQAVCAGKSVEFNPDNIYHMKFEPPAFLSRYTKGWGIPPFMSDFSTVIILKMLDRYNEAILQDYVVPTRVLSPMDRALMSGSHRMNSDLLGMVPFDDISAQIENMIEEHRVNPTTVHSLPFPLNYQVLGGEASSLIQVELQEHYRGRLLQNMGFPIEMIHKSMNNSVAPMLGFRMFERTWQHFSNGLNNWFTWFTNAVGGLNHWGSVRVETIPTSLYEDPEIKILKMELASAFKISMGTALKAIGLNHAEEQDKILQEEVDHQVRVERKQKEIEDSGINQEALRVISPGEQMLIKQEENMMAEQGGSPGGGGMGGAPGGGGMGGAPGGGSSGDNPGVMELDEQAQQLAMEIHGMESMARRQTLNQLAKDNEQLHMLVNGYLRKIESQAASQGVAMSRQEAQQETPGGAPPMG